GRLERGGERIFHPVVRRLKNELRPVERKIGFGVLAAEGHLANIRQVPLRAHGTRLAWCRRSPGVSQWETRDSCGQRHHPQHPNGQTPAHRSLPPCESAKIPIPSGRWPC